MVTNTEIKTPIKKLKKIVQVVPRLPPYPDGVGDYSLRLAGKLRDEHIISTHFFVFQQGITIEPLINGFSTIVLPAHSPETFLSLLPDDIEGIILHYSNYPYLKGKFDAPFWLVKALQLSMKQRELKLVVMFHELPMLKWKRINLLNPIQSLVSRRLAKIASTFLTDSARFQAILSKCLKQPVTCIPDFSTIGEPKTVPPLAERNRRMIIFGTSARRRLYENSLKELLECCKLLEIEEIYDIGKFLDLKTKYAFGKVHLLEMGFQPAEVVSQLMLTSLAGCLDYSLEPGDLGKSSVFAAFCAHGLVPLCTQYNPSEADGIEVKKNYLVLDDYLKQLNLEELQTVSDNAHQWYQSHNLTENAKVFASHL